jgi:TonB family protein
MSAREALIVASARYTDPLLRQLKAPEADAIGLDEVLSNPDIGGFQTKALIDRPSYEVTAAIEEFFLDRQPDDLLLLYFSGHGIKDADGRLFFATVDTKRSLLLSTSVPASMVNDAMLRSRSRRQVLILDCCHSGAFARGMVAKSDTSVGTIDHFQGTGRIVLTASDATQYALEAEQVTGSGARSIFTEVIVDGLKTGAADTNFDGLISLDELYAYTEDHVLQRTPAQKPMRWMLGATGELIIAENKHPVIQPAELPPYLIQALDKDSAPSFRQFAAKELGRILKGHDRALALAAELKLNELLEDDSRTIQELARGFLGDRIHPEDLEHQRQIKAENDRREQEEQERKAAAEQARLAEEKRQRQIAAENDRREQEEQERKAAAELARLAEEERLAEQRRVERASSSMLDEATPEPVMSPIGTEASALYAPTSKKVAQAEQDEWIPRHLHKWVWIASISLLLIATFGAWKIIKPKPLKPPQDTSAELTPAAQLQPAETKPAHADTLEQPNSEPNAPEKYKTEHVMPPEDAANQLSGAAAKPNAAVAQHPRKVAASAAVMMALLNHKVTPTYPPAAVAARVSGTVALQATIDTEGHVEQLKVVSGPYMLRQAALDVVKFWRYKPYLLNNEPVEVETMVNVVFKLSGPLQSAGPQANARAK